MLSALVLTASKALFIKWQKAFSSIPGRAPAYWQKTSNIVVEKFLANAYKKIKSIFCLMFIDQKNTFISNTKNLGV